MTQRQKVDGLIMEIENLDNAIISISSKRGITPVDQIQYLKYKRCYLISELAKLINHKKKKR